ncbi:MAG: hypothetical protein DCC43_14315 [Candidatus Brocadia sp.]|uniref:DUF104 domain-containing protein n=1 Tax=Candidatus Brocadia fulgida TaxID=380242 RepID=A0A0M2V2H8_9BACT|nr:MAG: hypothetical protein BROFUL_00362 [Candidatus Brocadia fulgida]MCC6324577.1 antitoxin family protein [Candidatus Brocadia sp.]MCE7912588.1 DUF104 domain-containing protein [Candidatus Brocadia sp. AMX3]MDG5997893.1 DUF104 domain-containing protein [Candidatus Brocadia sp.]RIJ91389.1 MAG: hypothetical protein DCC43_14315 [Candidatus Brocadia sp.]
MVKSVEAIFENGVFKPLEKMDLEEHKKVTIIVTNEPEEIFDTLFLVSMVYDGFSAQEIEDIEKVATDRSRFSRNGD